MKILKYLGLYSSTHVRHLEAKIRQLELEIELLTHKINSKEVTDKEQLIL